LSRVALEATFDLGTHGVERAEGTGPAVPAFDNRLIQTVVIVTAEQLPMSLDPLPLAAVLWVDGGLELGRGGA
jgi:hypothetical protein